MLIAEFIRNLFLRSNFHNIWFLNGLSIVSRITDLAYKTFPYMALMYYSSANTSPLPLYPHYRCHSVILWYGMNIPSYWLLFNYSILAHASVTSYILSHLPKMTSPSSLHSQCLLLKMAQALFIHSFTQKCIDNHQWARCHLHTGWSLLSCSLHLEKIHYKQVHK